MAIVFHKLNQHRTVVRELIPDSFVGLVVDDLAQRAAIDPGHHPPIDHNMVNKFREGRVSTAHGHLLREPGEIGLSGLAIIHVGPDLIMELIEPAVQVPSTMKDVGLSAAASIQPSRTGTCARSVSRAEPVDGFSKQPLFRCTDIS
jgi:hypothetical protein